MKILSSLWGSVEYKARGKNVISMYTYNINNMLYVRVI